MKWEVTSVAVDTLLYGEVILDYHDNVIATSYGHGDNTTVKISRIGNRTHDRTPIGTRAASNVHATIDGRPITLNPGRALIVKRSYKVDIQYDNRVLALAAKGLDKSIFLNGPKNEGHNVFGVLSQVYGGGIDVMWSTPFKFINKTVEPPTPSRDDVLVGIAVAAAFGTGGLSASSIIMGFVASVFP